MPPPDATDATCPLCGYDLRGQRDQAEPRCPECGRRFEWADFDPEQRRHPYLFEHHPERPIWSYFRTLIGGLRPRRFWASVNPAGPSNPRRMVIYWLVAATVWTAAALVGPMAASLVVEVHDNAVTRAIFGPAWWQGLDTESRRTMVDSFGSLSGYHRQRFPTSVGLPLLRNAVWNGGVSPSSWAYKQYWPRDYRDLTRLATPAWLLALAWPWLSGAAVLGLRASRQQARISRVAVMRAAAYSADLLIWMSLAFAAALASAIYVTATVAAAGSMARSLGPATWMPTIDDFALYLPAALACFWLVFAYRLYAAHRRYLRLPHALGVVLATQAVLLLIVANLYVLTLT